MNVLKNFEALFVVTLGLACAANYALDNTTATTPTPVVASAAERRPFRFATDSCVIAIPAALAAP